jgi:DNA sulfur modification protein DndE
LFGFFRRSHFFYLCGENEDIMLRRIFFGMSLWLLLSVVLAVGCNERKHLTIYMIGDSTMASKDTIGNPERGWGMALPLFFDPAAVRVENHAVNGRSTKSFIDQGRWDSVSVRLRAGDYVFIQFGHNDQKIEDTTRYAAPWGAYADNLRRFVRETRAVGAHPVLLTPIVRRHFDDCGVLVPTHGDYPDAVRRLAEQLDVPLIDMELASGEMIQSLGDSASRELFMHLEAGVYPKFPEGRRDDTHLRWAGAVEVARIAAKGIVEADLPLANYLNHESLH